MTSCVCVCVCWREGSESEQESERREREKKNFVNISVFWQWARTTLIKKDEKKSIKKWNQNIKRKKDFNHSSLICTYSFFFVIMNRIDEEDDDDDDKKEIPRTDLCPMIDNSGEKDRKRFPFVFIIDPLSLSLSRLCDWTDDSTTNFTLVQSPSTRQQTRHRLRLKDHLNVRSNSLRSSRQSSWSTSISNENIDEEIKQHRQHRRRRQRHVSDSSTNHTPTLLVTSFLQYLRHQLRTTTIERKNDYHRHTRQVNAIILNYKYESHHSYRNLHRIFLRLSWIRNYLLRILLN